MKVVILAGGLGSRLAEETETRPKPMVEIGGRPILWHIMKIYSSHGFTEFVVCLGYKGYMIKEYFTHFFLHSSDVTVDLAHNSLEYHESHAEPWKVTLVDTGTDSMTGGRIRRIQRYVENETFMLTYGDGVADVDIRKLLATHRSHGKQATITAVQPVGRFGALALGDDNRIESFREKPLAAGDWINGGFFVLEPAVFEYIAGDATVWEREPLEALTRRGELMAYRHEGFWRPMDTLRDKQDLDAMWQAGQAAWKVW